MLSEQKRGVAEPEGQNASGDMPREENSNQVKKLLIFLEKLRLCSTVMESAGSSHRKLYGKALPLIGVSSPFIK